MNPETAQVWASLAAGFGTLFLGFVALFGVTIREYYRRPKLEIRFGEGPPFQHVMPRAGSGGRPHILCVRVSIANVGRSAARAVEVVATALSTKYTQTGWARVEGWVPQNLTWAYADPETLVDPWMPQLSPGVEKHCNVAFVEERPAEDRLLLVLAVAVRSTAAEHRQVPGTYRIGLQVAAANAKAERRVLEVTLDPLWHPSTRERPEKTLEAELLP